MNSLLKVVVVVGVVQSVAGLATVPYWLLSYGITQDPDFVKYCRPELEDFQFKQNITSFGITEVMDIDVSNIRSDFCHSVLYSPGNFNMTLLKNQDFNNGSIALSAKFDNEVTVGPFTLNITSRTTKFHSDSVTALLSVSYQTDVMLNLYSIDSTECSVVSLKSQPQALLATDIYFTLDNQTIRPDDWLTQLNNINIDIFPRISQQYEASVHNIITHLCQHFNI